MAYLVTRRCVYVNPMNLVVAKLQCRKESNYTPSPMEILKQKITNGELHPDEYQTKVTEDLQRLYGEVQNYKPAEENLLSKWLNKNKKKKKVPKGLYIFGAVGGGKTMLMDLFFDSCHVSR